MYHLKLNVMPTEIITTDHLREFKVELLQEFRKILKEDHCQSEKKWLRSSEVKKMLGISTGTLQNMRINGTIPFSKVNGTLFYDYEDILKVMGSGKTEFRFSLDHGQ